MKANGWLGVGVLFVLAAMGTLAAPAEAQVQVTSANPNNAPQGTTNLIVKIGGNGFKRGATSQFFVTGTTNPGGITVNSTAFVSNSEVDANLTVSSTAEISGFDIYVTSSGRTGKGTDLFSVVQGTNGAPGQCTDIALRLIVAPQAPGLGGISGDGVSTYNNANDPAFDGGTEYDEGIAFQVCNGTNDFIVNLRGTSPVRYLNLDFSVQLASPDTAGGAVDLTGQQIHQQGEQINEMANAALYSNGQFITCSGFMLNPLSKTVTGGNAWFKPTTIYDPVVPDCLGGAGPDVANQPVNTSEVIVKQINACTWTVSPALDSSSTYRAGVGEVVKNGGHSTWVAGGQYHMPFSYEIQKLTCTP